MKKLLLVLPLLAMLLACSSEKKPSQTNEQDLPRELYHGFEKHGIDNIAEDLFYINNHWMLITAGNDTSFNTMTASWGGFGTIWGKPVTFITVRNTRYTDEFLQREPVYTISFYGEGMKQALQLLGSKSGRNSDKIQESGLKALRMPSGAMAFEEADMIIECKKLCRQTIDNDAIVDQTIVSEYYSGTPDDAHSLYFGEIIGVWKKPTK